MQHPATPTDLLRRWQIEGPRPRTLQAVTAWVAQALRRQEPDRAAALLRELLTLREDPVLWGFLAQAETAAGRPAKAADALMRHLRLAQDASPAVYVAAVDAWVEAGQKDKARRLAERAPTEELQAFLLQRLRQDTGRAPRGKAPKSVAALAALDRPVLMQILANLPLDTVAAALSGEKEPVRDAVLECFSGGPRRRLAALMDRETDAAARAAARKAVLAAAAAVR